MFVFGLAIVNTSVGTPLLLLTALNFDDSKTLGESVLHKPLEGTLRIRKVLAVIWQARGTSETLGDDLLDQTFGFRGDRGTVPA